MRRITIIGGGLAGLTLGIALRRSDVPVTIVEAGRYPRHRVCGEFISGAGVPVLEELGLASGAQSLAVFEAHEAGFFTAKMAAGKHRLPRPALCVSRFVLDARLSARFRELGGELREGERWREKSFREGLVCATGRRTVPSHGRWRWFGLKVHARNVKLTADLEMHLHRNSYVGICRLPDGEVNVCGLFRRRVGEPMAGESLDWLRGTPGSPLFARLEGAEFDGESFCAVGGLSLEPQSIDEGECRLGDALTMIPPITGNGMSMAFESARISVEPLLKYARGEQPWMMSTAEIARTLRHQFTRRLRFAAAFHRILFSTGGAAVVRLFRCTPIWRAAFALTR